MLRALRNQTQSIFFKIFLGLLICGFALWWVGDLTGGISQKPVLSVENKEVTTEQVINELNKLRYSKEEAQNIQFLNTLQNFKPEKIFLTKKFQEKTDAYGKLKRDQVMAYRETLTDAEKQEPLPKMPLTDDMQKARKAMIADYKFDPERNYVVDFQKAALYFRRAQR